MYDNKRLMRTRYPTDVNNEDPDYIGTFSAEFPDPARSTSTIVGVDWSERGFVWVTYLIPVV